MVCDCLRSSVESLACTCLLCCDLAKHYIFLAQLLRARMHGALTKVSGGWINLPCRQLVVSDSGGVLTCYGMFGV